MDLATLTFTSNAADMNWVFYAYHAIRFACLMIFIHLTCKFFDYCLRCYFAGHAMSALLSKRGSIIFGRDEVMRTSIEYANCMVKAMKKNND